MKHTIATTALVLASAAGMANAQASTITFEATVTEIVDAGGHFSSVQVGDSAVGLMMFDFSAPNNGEDGWLGSFEAQGLQATVNDLVFTGDGSINPGEVIVGDNVLIEAVPDDADFEWIQEHLVDWLNAQFYLPESSSELFAGIASNFVGTNDWFEGVDTLPDPATYGFENLARAEVVIEFFSWDEGFSHMTLELSSLSNADGTIATIGCQSTRFASPVAQLDFFDVSAFLTAFASQDSTADMNSDGRFDFFDVSGFITEIQSGCSN